MAATTAQPLTAAALIFGAGDAAAQVGAVLRAKSVVASLGGPVAALSRDLHVAVHDESARAGAGLFDLPVVTLLLKCLRTNENLREAARHTLAAPGASETVELAAHSFTQEYTPSLDVFVDGVPLGSIAFALTVEFAVKSLVAVVRGERLCALRSGDCDISATLAVQGIDALWRKTRLDLGLVVPLGDDGIALLSDEETIQAHG